jgi:hypothetical protein
MLRTNLQLFADDEVDEIDEIDLEEDVEDVEDLTEEEPEGDVTEEEPEVEPREQADRDRQLRQRLIDDGLTEQEADDRVSDRREREELKRELQSIKYGQQADKLASRYPTIHEHLDGFIAIVEASKGKLTLAELCKAKLDEATSHEIRTKAEQEALLTRQKAKDKQIKTGDVKTDSPVKLSSDDERILSNINKKKQQQGLPLMTRKQYLELSM